MVITKEVMEQNLANLKAQYDASAAIFNAGKALGLMEGQITLLKNLLAYEAQQPEAGLKLAESGVEQ